MGSKSLGSAQLHAHGDPSKGFLPLQLLLRGSDTPGLDSLPPLTLPFERKCRARENVEESAAPCPQSLGQFGFVPCSVNETRYQAGMNWKGKKGQDYNFFFRPCQNDSGIKMVM